MAGYVNTTPGLFIMPGGIEAVPGVEVDIDKEAAKNPSVAAWIADGRLVEAGKYAPAAADTIDGLRAQVADLTAQLEAANDQIAATAAAELAAMDAATNPAINSPKNGK